MSNPHSLLTFLFHDYETFGTSPSLDRPAQFAAIRSDTDFNIINDPEIFYCKPANDYLPQPRAVIITGITPQEARKKGVIEADFARRIHNLFTTPNTCVVGYNNIYFDDEFTRNIFYRNFYDPYTWSWQNGNSRLDLLNIMRACYALRPEGIIWPKNNYGLPSFRLEHLTRANSIEHNNAHNAIADVYATIAIAKLVKTAQPLLLDYLLIHRHKQKLLTLVNVPQMKPLVYVSGMLGAWRGNTSLIAPIAWHPYNRNILIAVDLMGNVTSLLKLNSYMLYERLCTKKETQDYDTSVPIILVSINKCPVLTKINTLRSEDAYRLGINREYCLENLKLLRANPDIRVKAISIFTDTKPSKLSDNIDEQLYNGFFTPTDRAAMNIVLKTKPQNIPKLNITFTDQRIKKLIFNYRARNYPSTLNKMEQELWLQHRQAIFTPEFLKLYLQELKILSVQYKRDSEKQKQLKELWRYTRKLYKELLVH